MAILVLKWPDEAEERIAIDGFLPPEWRIPLLGSKTRVEQLTEEEMDLPLEIDARVIIFRKTRRRSVDGWPLYEFDRMEVL